MVVRSTTSSLGVSGSAVWAFRAVRSPAVTVPTVPREREEPTRVPAYGSFRGDSIGEPHLLAGQLQTSPRGVTGCAQGRG